ncbi:MAG: hypothetical protein GWN00_14715, partial [Aliifodinibius sp.]|nr:hypothetical protein [Fodinibius sp.]NIV12345.1 hypothetical protein [Fodinibius sp.]NIY26012.1 hypothetical protein [Fodinibius sp.]
MRFVKATIIPLLFFILLLTTTNIQAQTTYEDKPGFFTPVIESLYLQGGMFEDTQLIGPAVGYRFNNRYDISLHAEFLFSELKYRSINNPTLSILNLGVTA